MSSKKKKTLVAQVSEDFFWEVKQALGRHKLTQHDAIVKGLVHVLDIRATDELDEDMTIELKEVKTC